MQRNDKEAAIESLKNWFENNQTPLRIYISTYKISKGGSRRELRVHVLDDANKILFDMAALVGTALGHKVNDYPSCYTIVHNGSGFDAHWDLTKRLSEVLGTKLDYQSI